MDRFSAPSPRPQNTLTRPPKRTRRWWIIFFILGICFATLSLLSWKDNAAAPTDNYRSTHLPFLRTLESWLSGIKKSSLTKDERLNFLILGQGGVGHEGPYLTDTIILVSVRPKNGDVVMLSIPRDLAVPVPGLGLRKVNAVNAIGESEAQGRGAALAANVVGQTFGVPIAGYVRIDFKGFVELVNILGGVDINVEYAFTDPSYPDGLDGVMTVSFHAGEQHMDGETALKYVRSRHGTNGQGSDFARARRQQQVLLSLRDKIFRFSTLLSPGKIAAIVNSVEKNIETNIPTNQFDDLLLIARRTEGKIIAQRVLDSSPGGILKDEIDPDGAYLLMPADGNYGTLARFVQNLFIYEDLRSESATIAILNGTNETGLASHAAIELSSVGLNVLKVGNAPSRNWHETVVFDLNKGKEAARAYLTATFNARLIETIPPPQEIMNAAIRMSDGTETQPDFILILGK
ncbi:MAG: LCP family protein [Patescibacteria group bacterium]